MADVAGILQLMRHAADLLKAQDGIIRDAFAAQRREALERPVGQREGPLSRSAAELASYTAASTLAQTMLKMVATFMEEGDDPDA